MYYNVNISNIKFTIYLQKDMFMRKIIFKAIPALIISSGMLFAQYYDPYNYQNGYNYQNNQNNYNAYQNNNIPANNYYNNYYQEFMRTLSEEANNPNSIYYSPGFYEQYNDYNAMHGNPYQDTMNAMNWASQNYNAHSYYNEGSTAQNPYQNNYYNGYDNTYQDPYQNNYYGGYDNTAQNTYQSGYDNYNNQAYNNTASYVNPYEELMKMLEREAKNPNSPYYSPNANQNGYNESYDSTAQNNYYNDYNAYDNTYQNNYYSAYDNTAQDQYQNGYYTGYDYNAYTQTNNNMSDDPYKLAAEALIKAAEELTIKANGMPNQNNTANQNLNNNNQLSANTQNTPLYVQDFYTPFKVPQVVLDTAAAKYPNVQILDVEVKEIGTYEVRMANNMRLYIDRNGNFLREIVDY